MMRALYTAATGMIAEQTNLDTISHNLSNVNTTGYKTEKTEFKSLLYQTIQTRTTSANGEQKPIGAQVGLGTRVAAVTSVFEQGSLLASEKDTDFAIEGNGFFAVRGADGERYYTRNGNFTWSVDANGNTILTDNEGCPVLNRDGGVIQVPQGSSSEAMEFSQTGEIGYMLPSGEYVSLNQFMAVYQFNNPSGLEKLSSSKLTVSEASGEPMLEGVEEGLSTSKICRNFLEGSNVQVADEMVNMIVAQRAYQLNSKAITTADSMLEIANNLKR